MEIEHPKPDEDAIMLICDFCTKPFRSDQALKKCKKEKKPYLSKYKYFMNMKKRIIQG